MNNSLAASEGPWGTWWANASSMWGLSTEPIGADPCSLVHVSCCSLEGKYISPKEHAAKEGFIAVLQKHGLPVYRTAPCSTPGDVVSVSFSSASLQRGSFLHMLPDPPEHIQLVDLTNVKGTNDPAHAFLSTFWCWTLVGCSLSGLQVQTLLSAIYLNGVQGSLHLSLTYVGHSSIFPGLKLFRSSPLQLHQPHQHSLRRDCHALSTPC